MSRPTFSVVICNYNYARFVADAVNSVLSQDYPAELVEVIVVDDGSTDGSLSVLERYRDHPQVRCISQPNRGQTAACEAGVRAAGNEFICLLDSDDLCLPQRLSRVSAWIVASGVERERLFLCHDLLLRDDRSGETVEQRWFDIVGIRALGARYDLDGPPMFFPFSVPAGLVFSRALLARCLEGIPPWVFPRGTDGVLCPAALVLAGEVHYLHEPLGLYRIHADNEFASLQGGRYTPRIDLRDRTPRQLHFLDQWIDTAGLPPAQRARARGYFRRWERLQRTPTPDRGCSSPRVSVALVGDAEARALAASADSIAALHYAHLEALLPESGIAQPDSTRFALLSLTGMPGTGLHALIAALRAASGDFIVFLPAGDRLDRDFIDRHLHYRMHGALVGVSCSDIRLLAPDGALLHSDAYMRSGAWQQPVQQVPPLASTLAQWAAPPLAACMFDRRLLAEALAGIDTDALPADMVHAGGWLPVQLALHLTGMLRFRETLSGVVCREGGQASYGWLSAPHRLDGSLVDAPLAGAGHWFADWKRKKADWLGRTLPPAWHRRFDAWLDAQRTN
ncbi:glycosyltransferase family 2 protein [Methyloversatilis thermotolerans]|uniref:glycosyltransferase family 2 protein n=1 Tax=Methyloversatilis thermotolerans TaxID=1346290 RepID=UPI000372FBF1|nr:glycosyltransferase [Methyloversatilis thermotolerans]